MPQDELSFLGGKITTENLETDYFLLEANPVFVTIPFQEELQRDQLFLKFGQKLWEIPEKKEKQILQPYYTYFYLEIEDNVPFYVHDIIFQDQLIESVQLTKQIQCVPTLSFRTLVLDELNHIKFGIPIFFGAAVRYHTKVEVLHTLYLSDYIRQIQPIHKLRFFLEYKGYSIPSLENYSVSYRLKPTTADTMPFSGYFNKLLNHSSGNAEERLSQTLNFLRTFFQDFEIIYQSLEQNGLGLELHGQNLLVELSSDGSFAGTYVYRDFGACTLAENVCKKQTVLNAYYAKNYKFEFTQFADPGYMAWMNYRIFFLSFILHNLAAFAKKEKLSFSPYNWFEQIADNLSFIRSIY